MNFEINKRYLPSPNNINVSCEHTINSLIVTWDRVKNPDENIVDGDIVGVGYNVYRGTSMSGIFYKVNANLVVNSKFEDTKISLNVNTQYFYKVATVAIYRDNSQNEGPISAPAIFMVPTTNKWFKKMNERNMWILKNTGVLMELYTRKTEGPRCEHCYDEYRGQSEDPNCIHCFGTTFDGGYEPMFSLYVRQKSANQAFDLTNQGYAQNNSPGAWTISKYLIKNRDLLINPYGQIFSVTNANVSHAAGFFFHQELQTKELDRTQVIYQLKRKPIYPEI